MASPFTISKWYMDCVSEAGEVVVGYSSRMQWRRLAKGYSSTLEYDGSTPPRSRVSARGFELPASGHETLTWSCGPLNVAGEWTALDPPFARRLFENDSGTIDWSCILPRARARIEKSRSGAVVSGLGYVERLDMSVDLSRLPIEELHWGRFLGSDGSIVWIEWRGPHPLRLVFRNGIAEPAAALDSGGIEFGDGVKLVFEDRVVLREGTLAETTLADQRALRMLLPRRVLETYECKWRSRGRLLDPRGEEVEGWLLHEVMRWGNGR